MLMKTILINKFFYIKGGAETVFFQEREYLLAQGHRIIDFSMMDDRNFFSRYSSYFINNIDYQQNRGLATKIKHAIKFIHSSEAVNKLEELISREKPVLAHLHNIYHQLTPAIIPVLKKNGVKVILTLHDYKLICPSYSMVNGNAICSVCEGKYFWKPFTKNCQNSLSRSTLLMIEALYHKWKGSYEFVDMFIAPSQFMAEAISKKVPENKIRILKNGIDTDEYEESNKDDEYGLYFGRLSKEKGVETLLQAHDKINNPIHLKLAGTGPLEKDFKKIYLEPEYLGYKHGNELKTIISRASFVIVPSEWCENCSMTVLESMAMGKPVIASNIGGIPEQIEDGKTGLLFGMGDTNDLSDKIVLLTSNRELRKKLGKKARKKLIREYSLGDHYNKLIQLYEEVLYQK